MATTSTRTKNRPDRDDVQDVRATSEAASPGPPRLTRVFLYGLVSAIALWAAFPPVNAWPLAWLAPIGWCLLIRSDRLDAARPYRVLYGVGLIHWLLLIHWIRLPHWSAYFGWLALSLYLAVYLPLFIGLSRVLVHRWRWPVMLAAPTIWCGLELARGYMLTGFSMGLLGHTQVSWLPAIQIADVGGAYAVGFVVMGVAAGIATAVTSTRISWAHTLAATGASAVLLLALLGYGHWRLDQLTSHESAPVEARVALIQGCRDTTFSAADDPRDTLDQYRELTQQAIAAHPDTDLIVWPESMHTTPWVVAAKNVLPPPDFPESADRFREWLDYSTDHSKYEAGWFSRQFAKPAVVGCAALEFAEGDVERYNRALWLDAAGRAVGTYDKMHPVMFGEYVPLGSLFPWLYRLTPMGNGLTAGRRPLAVKVGPVSLSPSICFENTVPHLIRRQVRQLTDEGQAPDALLTISNDGWFWGSSQLDLHLTCGVFRAVELRLPALVAANTGFSAWIDRRGEIRAQGPRRETGYLVAELSAAGPATGCYRRYGDIWSGLCLLVCAAAGIEGFRSFHRAPTAAA